MTYDVLLTKKDEKFIARVRQWPEIVVEGATEEDALAKARADLRTLLMKGRIVQIDLDVAPGEHPWLKFAGMFADDPDWQAFQESIKEYREKINKITNEE
jgi:hypothetical protein